MPSGTYQKDVEAAAPDAEEKVSLLAGYGSVDREAETSFGVYTDNGEDCVKMDTYTGVRPPLKMPKWAWLAAGLAVYAGFLGLAWNHQPSSGARLILSEDQQEILDVELLGKSKSKHAKKKKEKKPKFEPVTYPDCPSGVDVTYVKERLTFEEHEVAAAAADCHLASIHNLEENSKYSKAGLFKMSYGPGECYHGGNNVHTVSFILVWNDGSSFSLIPCCLP